MADIDVFNASLPAAYAANPLDEWEYEFYLSLDAEEQEVWLKARDSAINPETFDLPSSGQIAMSQIRNEVGGSGQCSLNDADFRALINKNSQQQQAMSDYWGKKASAGYVSGTPNKDYGNMGDLMNNEGVTCYGCPQQSGNTVDTVWGVTNSCYTVYDGYKECAITPTWTCPTAGGGGSVKTFYQELGYFDNQSGTQWFWIHVKRTDNQNSIPIDSSINYKDKPFTVSWSGGSVSGKFYGHLTNMGSARQVLMSRPVSGLNGSRGKAVTWAIT